MTMLGYERGKTCRKCRLAKGGTSTQKKTKKKQSRFCVLNCGGYKRYITSSTSTYMLGRERTNGYMVASQSEKEAY